MPILACLQNARASSRRKKRRQAAALQKGEAMRSAKDEVRRILEQIPDNASFEDIQYHIYVREKIDRGLEDVEQGRVISQDEVERRMRK